MKTFTRWFPRFASTTLAALAALWLAPLMAGGAEATAPAQLFAISSDLKLWRGDPAGTNQLTPLPLPGKIVHFQVAPTQDRMLYVAMEEVQRTVAGQSVSALGFKLFVSTLDGDQSQLLSDQVDDPNVYFIQTIASRLQPMFWDSGGPLYPQWCPDGRRILFNGRRADDGSYPVYVADATDKTIKTLLTIPATKKVELGDKPIDELMPSHPMAVRFIQQFPFAKLQNANPELDLPMPDRGRAFRAGVEPKPVWNAWFGSAIHWHPDGKSLTWACKGNAQQTGIYTRDATGFNPDKPEGATKFIDGEDFLWAPNGQQVAILREYGSTNGLIGHQVLLAGTNGQITRVLHNDPLVPPQRIARLRLLAWSPDSARLAIYMNAESQRLTTRIFDLVPATNSFVDLTNTHVPRGSFKRELVRGIAGFTPDSSTYCFIGFTNTDGRVKTADLVSVTLPPHGIVATQELALVRRTLLPGASALEEFAIVQPKESQCPPLELVIPAAGRDLIFAQTSEDTALAITDADAQKEALAEVRARRDRWLGSWVRLPELQQEHKQRTEELKQWLKKPDPASASWTPWQPTEWDKQRRWLERHLREVETEYLRCISPVWESFSESEERRLLDGLNARLDCLREQTAKALDDVRGATATNLWSEYSRKKNTYELNYAQLTHTLNFAQSLHGLRLMAAQSRLGAARHGPARDGTLTGSEGAKALRPFQRRLRDVYLDLGETALQLNQAQAEAGLLAQDSYLTSFWGVYKQADKVEFADTLRGQAFQGMIFGTRALVAGGQSAMSGLVDTFKRAVNLGPEHFGYSLLDTVSSEITTQLNESRETTDLAVRTLRRLRGLSDELTLTLLDRSGDAGVTQLQTNRVFIEQGGGGVRRLVMCYETDPVKLMEHEFLAAQTHAATAVADMEKVFNARVLADAKGEFPFGQKLKRLLADPLGTAKVFIQNSDFGGDHFSAPLEHIALRKAQVQEMQALLPWLQRAKFNPTKLAQLSPRMFALYQELGPANPDFLQWTLTRQRLAAQQNVDLLERELVTAAPEDRPELRQKIAANRALVALEASERQAWLLQLQGLDKMMMWDYDAALECFYQASECNTNALPRANVERLRADLNWQRTIEVGMESFQQTGNLAVQAALFEFVGGAIGEGLGMTRGGAAATTTEAAIKAGAEEEFILLRALPASKFCDFVWKQFNPFAEFLNAWYEQASLVKVGQQTFALGVNVGTQVVQNDLMKKAVLKGWCGLDDQWADFLANAIVSTVQVKPGGKHTLFWELCLRVKAADAKFHWMLVDLGVVKQKQAARRSLSDFYFFQEMCLQAKKAREEISARKLSAGDEAAAKAETAKLAEAEANQNLKLRPLTKETLQERLGQFLGDDPPTPGSKERLAQIAKFFQGLKWKELMKLGLPKDDGLNRQIDNLRRELIAALQVEFFNDPRFAKYREHMIAYLYIGSAGKKTSAAYKRIDSDIDFTVLVREDTPESVRNQLREDFMGFFQEAANGMALEDFEMSVMVDPMPRFERTGETAAGIVSILWLEATPQERADARAKLRAGIEKTIEQLIRNASDKERYLDRGNLFRHNLFVRLGCFLKKAGKVVSEEGVELEDLPPEQYDALYGDVPLEPWMAFDAVVGNLGYIVQHALEHPNDTFAYQKVLSGKYAIRGGLFSMLLMSPKARERLSKLTRAEVEANGWEGAERICVEVAKEILAQPDGLKELGLPTVLDVPGGKERLAMDAAAWVRLFEEWNYRKEGLPLNEVFGKPRRLRLDPDARQINAYLAENIAKTEAFLKAALRKAILEQGTALKQLQAAMKHAKELGDVSAAEILELKMKEILISQAAVWNRMGREQQLLVLKEMPPEADWWPAIASVEGLKEASGTPAPTPANPNRVVLDRAALLAWRPGVFMNAPPEDIARRITLLKEQAATPAPALLNNNPQAAP